MWSNTTPSWDYDCPLKSWFNGSQRVVSVINLSIKCFCPGPVSKDLMSGASSVIGSSSESHLSSPTSSGPGSPARPGYANKGFMAGTKNAQGSLKSTGEVQVLLMVV